MSEEKKIGCVLAAVFIATVGFGVYLMGGCAGLAGYALGSIFAGQWVWSLRGVK